MWRRFGCQLTYSGSCLASSGRKTWMRMFFEQPFSNYTEIINTSKYNNGDFHEAEIIIHEKNQNQHQTKSNQNKTKSKLSLVFFLARKSTSTAQDKINGSISPSVGSFPMIYGTTDALQRSLHRMLFTTNTSIMFVVFCMLLCTDMSTSSTLVVLLGVTSSIARYHRNHPCKIKKQSPWRLNSPTDRKIPSVCKLTILVNKQPSNNIGWYI